MHGQLSTITSQVQMYYLSTSWFLLVEMSIEPSLKANIEYRYLKEILLCRATNTAVEVPNATEQDGRTASGNSCNGGCITETSNTQGDAGDELFTFSSCKLGNLFHNSVGTHLLGCMLLNVILNQCNLSITERRVSEMADCGRCITSAFKCSRIILHMTNTCRQTPGV